MSTVPPWVSLECTYPSYEVVVQWLDFSPVTQQPGVRFPTGEKVASTI